MTNPILLECNDLSILLQGIVIDQQHVSQNGKGVSSRNYSRFNNRSNEYAKM